MKKREINMHHFLPLKSSVDYDLKRAICGVFYDFNNEVAVASDGHILCVSKAAYNPTYKKEVERGLIIDKEGHVIEGRYPDYESIMPIWLNDYTELSIDKNKIKTWIKDVRNIAKEKQVKAMSIFIKIADHWYNAKYIEKMFRVADKFWYKTSQNQIVLYGESDLAKVILLPMLYNANNANASVILRSGNDIILEK